MVGATSISVGAAEGCEGGYRFAAFGSSYRELRMPLIPWERIHSRREWHGAVSTTPKQVGYQAASHAFDFDLGAPLNHAGRKPILIRRANRHGCRFSRAGPWMALRGGLAESMSDYGYAERQRGTEWWGTAFLVTFLASEKSDPL